MIKGCVSSNMLGKRNYNIAHIAIPKDKINQFCTQNQIKRLALFGLVLREDFRHDSDIDAIVEFSGLEC